MVPVEHVRVVEEARGDAPTEKAGEPLVRLVGGVTTVQGTVVAATFGGFSCSELPRLDSDDRIHSPEVAGDTGVKALGAARAGRVDRRP